MSEQDDWLASDAPVSREVSVGGKVATFHFRKISAGERYQLLKGQRIQARQGEKAVFDLDLGENQQTKFLLVSFAVCKPDGSKFFADVKAVQKLDASKVDALYEHANAVNEEAEPGKS